MFTRLVHLVLIPLLLLPPGVCPCHLFEDHPDEDATFRLMPPAEHDPLARESDQGPHPEEPCDDCLARKLVAGQYTTHSCQSFAPDAGMVYLFPDCSSFAVSVAAAGPNYSLPGPVYWSSTLPVYLTLRTLLI